MGTMNMAVARTFISGRVRSTPRLVACVCSVQVTITERVTRGLWMRDRTCQCKEKRKIVQNEWGAMDHMESNCTETHTGNERRSINRIDYGTTSTSTLRHRYSRRSVHRPHLEVRKTNPCERAPCNSTGDKTCRCTQTRSLCWGWEVIMRSSGGVIRSH